MKYIILLLSLLLFSACTSDYIEPTETKVEWTTSEAEYINNIYGTIQILYAEVPNSELLKASDDISSKLNVIYLYMHQGPFMDTIEEYTFFDEFMIWCEKYPSLTHLVDLYNNGI